MGEQDGVQSPTKQRRSRKAGTTNQQNGKQAPATQRPLTNDPEAWKAYWKQLGQPWRTESEIDEERQKHLAERRGIEPDIQRGTYPFRAPNLDETHPNIKLSRADVEWLLATHESRGMHGPVDWSDITQRKRFGLDLRGADLSREDLRNLPLARLQGGLAGDNWRQANTQQRQMAAIHLEETPLAYCHLEGSILTHAHLEGTVLNEAHLEGVDAFGIYLNGPTPASLRLAYFDASTKLDHATIANDKHIGARLLDAHWGGVNLTGIDWSSVHILFDEFSAGSPTTVDGKTNEKQRPDRDYQRAIRAYRQLSVVLRNQGLNEDAARFAFRAQLMQRKVFWHQGIRSLGQYLFSLFLDLLTGYGYKPIRSFITYAVVISVFALIYFLLGSHLAWNEAIVISMTAFHGRGFFPEQFKPGDPQALVAALEAFIGLIIEVTFIATLTQRLFGK